MGPTVFSHFGFIHFFGLLVIYSFPAALFGIKRGNLAIHRAHVIGVYVGGIVAAGGLRVNVRAFDTTINFHVALVVS